MTCSACQNSADQANDVLSYMATLSSGFLGARADQLPGAVWVPPEWSGKPAPQAPRRKTKAKGCQKQGPGCKNAACNTCADHAVDAINYAAGFEDGIPRATDANILAAKMGGGGAKGSHHSPARAGERDDTPAGLQTTTDCSGCTVDANAVCGNSLTSPTSSVWAVSHHDWEPVVGGGCQMEVRCADYSESCPWGDPGSAVMGAGSAADHACMDNGLGHVLSWNSWVYVKDGVGEGSCYAVWNCEAGVTPPTPYVNSPGMKHGTSWEAMGQCEGVRTSSTPPNPQPPGIDLEGTLFCDPIREAQAFQAEGCRPLRRIGLSYAEYRCPWDVYGRGPIDRVTLSDDRACVSVNDNPDICEGDRMRVISSVELVTYWWKVAFDARFCRITRSWLCSGLDDTKNCTLVRVKP